MKITNNIRISECQNFHAHSINSRNRNVIGFRNSLLQNRLELILRKPVYLALWHPSDISKNQITARILIAHWRETRKSARSQKSKRKLEPPNPRTTFLPLNHCATQSRRTSPQKDVEEQAEITVWWHSTKFCWRHHSQTAKTQHTQPKWKVLTQLAQERTEESRVGKPTNESSSEDSGKKDSDATSRMKRKWPKTVQGIDK